MEVIQGKGSISVAGGGNERYARELEKIRNNSLYRIYNNLFELYLNDKEYYQERRGHLSVGPKLWISFNFGKGVKSLRGYLYSSDINRVYQEEGIDALKPLSFSAWEASKTHFGFSIKAELKTPPNITELHVQGENTRENIILTWNSTLQETFTVIAKVGDETRHRGTGTTATTYSIPPNLFRDKEKVVITLKIEYSQNGHLNENAFAMTDINIVAKNTDPEITEIKTYDLYLDKSTRIEWSSNRQERFVLEHNGQRYEGNRDKFFDIPFDNINLGINNAKLTIFNTVNGIETSATKDFTFNATAIGPKIEEFYAQNMTLSWKGQYLKNSIARVEIFNKDLNNNKVADFNINSTEFAKGRFDIPGNITFFDGNHTVKMYISVVIKGETFATTTQTDMIVSNRPYTKINSLEPAEVPRNYEKQITITWDSINQKTFNLQVIQNNQIKFEKSGTTEKTVILPERTLINGTASIKLTITNSIYDILKQDTKTVSFNLYGGVKPPTISVDAPNNTLNKNNLNISWNSTDLQRYYRVEFEIVRTIDSPTLDNFIRLDTGYTLDKTTLIFTEDSGVVRSRETTYKSKNVLFKNDIIRNIKVTIYNELKEENSNIYEHNINVNYTLNGNIVLNTYSQDNKIIVNCIVSNSNNLRFRLFRGTNTDYASYREVYSTTQTNFVYEDNNVKSDKIYSYYVIASDVNKSIKSKVVSGLTKVTGYLFTNTVNNLITMFNLEVSAEFETNDGKVVVEFLGKSTADIERDETNYQVGNFSCLVHKTDLSDIDNLFNIDYVGYRDRKGNGFICNLMNKKISYNDRFNDYVRLSFDMIENDSLKLFD